MTENEKDTERHKTEKTTWKEFFYALHSRLILSLHVCKCSLRVFMCTLSKFCPPETLFWPQEQNSHAVKLFSCEFPIFPCHFISVLLSLSIVRMHWCGCNFLFPAGNSSFHLNALFLLLIIRFSHSASFMGNCVWRIKWSEEELSRNQKKNGNKQK